MSAMEWPRPIRQALTVLIIAILVILVVFGTQILMNRRSQTRREGVAMKELPCSSEHTIQGFGLAVLYSDANSLVGQPVDPKKESWVIEFTQPDTKYRAENDRVVTWTEHAISVYDAQGKLQNGVSIAQSVLDVRVGLNMIAVWLGGPSEYIEVLDAVTLLAVDMRPIDGTLLDFGFFSRDDQLWCTTLETAGASLNSSVMITAPKRASYGLVPVDSGLLIYKVIFNTNISQLALISTHQMNYYDQKLQLLPSEYQRQLYGWQLLDAHAAKDTTFTIFAPVSQLSDTGESTISSLRLYYGMTESQLRLPAPCKRVIAGEKAIYAVSDSCVYRYAYPDPKGKADTAPLEIKPLKPIEAVRAILPDDTLVVTSEAKVYLLPT